MSERRQFEGLKAATEKTREIIALSTGVIALTVTFFEKFGQTAPGAVPALPWTLFAAWGCFGISIVAAVWTLGAITGTLDCLDRKANGQTLDAQQELAVNALSNGRNIRLPAVLMDLSFVIALGFTIASGFLRA